MEILVMVDLGKLLNNMLDNIIAAIPSILAAFIVIILGVLIGILVGKLVNSIVKKMGFEKVVDQTSVGRSLRSAGMDPSNLLGSVAKVLIIVLAIIYAIDLLNIGGAFGSGLSGIANYLPRLLAGVLIILLGVIFADFLASFIGKIVRPSFSPEKGDVADALRNLLFIGFIALVLLLALDTMRLSSTLIYPLILGFVVIGMGISITDILVRSIIADHAEFKDVAGYAKFVLYSVFLIIGAGALFATFPGVTTIIANISWAFAIALAIMLVPIAYALTKKMYKQMD
jgi:hypothetical protein